LKGWNAAQRFNNWNFAFEISLSQYFTLVQSCTLYLVAALRWRLVERGADCELVELPELGEPDRMPAEEPLAGGLGLYRTFLELVTLRVETDAFFPHSLFLHPTYTQTHTSPAATTP
jgi:hypothetical protein